MRSDSPETVFRGLSSACSWLAALAFLTADFNSNAATRKVFWFGGGTLSGPPENVNCVAIGEQGVLGLVADGGVAVLERKEGSIHFIPPLGLTNAVAIGALGNAAGALRTDGRVVTWGTYPRTPPASLSNAVAIAVGGDVTLALRADGNLESWADSGATIASVPPGLDDVVAISTSWTYNNALALRADGTVASWGARSAAANIVPNEATNVIAIAAGLEENFVLRADGKVIGWGGGQENGYRPPGQGPFYTFAGVSNIIDISAGPGHVLALTSEGRVLDYGGADLGLTNGLWVSPVDARGFLVLTGDGSPVLVNQPSDITGSSGQRLRLIGKVGGNRPMSLQWYKDGTPVAGAAGPVLLLNNAAGSDAGSYQLAASNALGQVVSRLATVRIQDTPPSVRRITLEPTTHTPFVGGVATLHAEILGSAPMRIQWMHAGRPIPNATNASMSLVNLRRDQSGDYTVMVSNDFGSASSTPFRLNIAELVIWGNPIIQSYGVPAAATDVVQVSTSESTSIALRADGTAVTWDNGSATSSMPPPPGLNGLVAVAAGPGYNLALTSDGRITGWGWNYSALGISSSLSNIIAIAAGAQYCLALRSDGRLLAFGDNELARRAAAGGIGGVVGVSAYLKYGLVLKSDGTVANVGDTTLFDPPPPDLRNATAIALGRGNAQALRADGTVLQWGTIYDVNLIPQPAGLSDAIAIANGGDHVLALRADGTVVGWGADGQRQATIPADLKSVAAIAAAYTHSIALVDNGHPRIFQHPLNVTAVIGGNARLAVQAIGESPLHYQWRAHGQPIALATNAVLALDDLSFLDTDQYDAVVSNSQGSVTSRVATITASVSAPFNAVLQIQPATGAALLHGNATLTANAEGTTPFAYQWLREGAEIARSYEPILRLKDISLSDAGNYSVVVANPFGMTTSAPVRLVVTQVAAWGGDYDRETEVPASATNVVAVFSGMRHGVALRQNGTVAVWGNTPKDGGMLGGGALVPPAGLSNVVAVAGGDGFNVALKLDGTLVGWGDNSFGQLTGSSQLSNVVSVSAGHAHTLALRADGTIRAVGANYDGQLDFPPGVNDYVAVAAGLEFSLALRANGTVVQAGRVYYWGDFLPGEPPPGATNIVAISAGQYHALALRADGALFEWGIRENDALPRPDHLTDIVMIAAGAHHNLVLRMDGDVVAWGADWLGQAEVPTNLHSVVSIAAGCSHSYALIGGGPPRILQQPLSVDAVVGGNARLVVSATGSQPFRYQWRQSGRSLAGATRSVLALDNLSFFDGGDFDVVVSNLEGASTSRVASVSVRFEPPANVALKLQPANGIAYLGGTALLTTSASGSPPFAYQWIFPDQSVLNTHTGTLRLEDLTFADAGDYLVKVANVLGSATSPAVRVSVLNVAAWGGRNVGSDNRVYNLPVGVTNAVQVSASQWHALALRPDGTAIGWGDPASGKLAIPGNATNLSAVTAGGEFSLGLCNDGSVVVWGDSGNQFGVKNLPAGLSNVVQLSAAYSWALALKSDGTLAQWGTYIGGYMKPPPSGLTNVIQISAGARHALALVRDGTVVAWGSDDLGQATPPQGLSNVAAVVAGNSYSMALCENGTVIEWGRDAVSAPPEATNLVAIATGNFHRVGLREDGKVLSWGYENGGAGQTRVPPDLPPVVAICAAGDASFAVIPATGEPHIARQPRSRQFFTGQPIQLEVLLFPGADEVRYQWYKDGGVLGGATNRTFSISSALKSDSGKYKVRAWNDSGAIISREAEIIVLDQAPRIVAEPADVLIASSGTFSLWAPASGSYPLYYQWFFNGRILSGATTASLVCSNATSALAGMYQLVVTNSFGSATSRLAQVRVERVVSLSRATILVNTNGYFLLELMVSEPSANPSWVTYDYGAVVGFGEYVLRYGVVQIPAGAPTACTVIRDPALAEALAMGGWGELHLDTTDFGILFDPAQAIFGLTDSPETPSCDRAGQYVQFLPNGIRRRPDGRIELLCTAPPTWNLTVEFSTDLRTWLPASGIYSTDILAQRLLFIEQQPTTNRMRFYRMRQD